MGKMGDEMTEKGICADLLQRIEKLERAVFDDKNPVPEPQDFCCVDEPPDKYCDVYLLGGETGLSKNNKFIAAYSDVCGLWFVRGAGGSRVNLAIPRTAMQGVRWTHIREGE